MTEPEYIDIHSHISFSDFNADREAVVARMKEKNIWAIDVGVDFENSKKASETATNNQGIFASAGLHPMDGVGEDFDATNYKKIFTNPKVIAVGECGLDYFRLGKNNQASQKLKVESEKGRQKKFFEMQVGLALEFNKPLMIHCRDAYADLLEILRSYSVSHGSRLRGNMHFFAGDWNDAKKFLNLGFTLSFTGVITFTGDYDEVIKNTPLNMIMAETDSPFVAPIPHRGKRNEPIYVAEVVKQIAQIRGEDLGKTKEQILKNSLKLFDFFAFSNSEHYNSTR